MNYKNYFSFKPLRLCDFVIDSKDIKPWVALNYVIFNNNKTDVIIFEQSGISQDKL